jgi:hypothetical protein
MGPRQLIDELTDAPAPNTAVQTLVDFVADHDRKLAIHIVYTYCTRITGKLDS